MAHALQYRGPAGGPWVFVEGPQENDAARTQIHAPVGRWREQGGVLKVLIAGTAEDVVMLLDEWSRQRSNGQGLSAQFKSQVTDSLTS